MEKPPYDDARRCIRLRCKSKRGDELSREEYKFCADTCSKFDEWYAKTEAVIFNRTTPFGSRTKMKVDPEVMEYVEI